MSLIIISINTGAIYCDYKAQTYLYLFKVEFKSPKLIIKIIYHANNIGRGVGFGLIIFIMSKPDQAFNIAQVYAASSYNKDLIRH